MSFPTEPTNAAHGESSSRRNIPDTVSAEAEAQLRMIYAMIPTGPVPLATSLADWDARAATTEALVGGLVAAFADRIGIVRIDEVVGGVPVLRIRPPNWRPGGRTHVYVHGGGYVTGSAKSSLIVPSLLAVALGDEVISIDYTLAPRGTWQIATAQVVSVWTALLANGVEAASTGLFGDSAGGGLAAGSVFRMRDEGIPLPGALWLLSPWSDITGTGDTNVTLAAADPTLDGTDLKACAAVYAASADQRHPYVSPIYGDYAQSFPPTLIQVGTREIFLSNAVRHYQAIRAGGWDAVLDVYEGMPHVFQVLASRSPETSTSIERARTFFDRHLGGRQPR